jgi:hypothetical protein
MFIRLRALVDRGIVVEQFVLLSFSRPRDGRDMRLRRLVAVEIAACCRRTVSGPNSFFVVMSPRRDGSRSRWWRAARSWSAPMPLSLSIARTGRSRNRFTGWPPTRSRRRRDWRVCRSPCRNFGARCVLGEHSLSIGVDLGPSADLFGLQRHQPGGSLPGAIAATGACLHPA